MVDPTELWEFMKNIISNHRNVMCPIKFIRIRTSTLPWITHEILEAINDRHLYYKAARLSGTNHDHLMARSQRNRVNRLINSSKASYIKETLEHNVSNPKKFWRILNENLLKVHTRAAHAIFNKGNNEYTTTTDSSEFMNEYLANVGVDLYAQFENAYETNEYEHVYGHDGSDDAIVFNLEDVTRVVKNIDVHKSSGIDFLPTFVLKDYFMVLS